MVDATNLFVYVNKEEDPDYQNQSTFNFSRWQRMLNINKKSRILLFLAFEEQIKQSPHSVDVYMSILYIHKDKVWKGCAIILL